VKPPVLTVIDYDTLMAAITVRIDQLQISYECIDDLCGWSNYIGRVVGPTQSKTIGNERLWKLMEVLAIQFVVADDPDALAKMAPLWEKREDGKRRVGNTSRSLSPRSVRRLASAFGRLGNRSRNTTMPPQQRAEVARQAANARWEKWRNAQP
jgi:hypothetical protein